MLINWNHFDDRPYKVPNQEESRDFNGAAFIENKEEELAIKYLLGYDLFTEFTTEKDSAVAKWANLRDGAEYVFGDYTYRYKGWIHTIRPGIYADWLQIGTYKFTNIGWIENAPPQQSKVIDNQDDFNAIAWNDFCRNVGILQNRYYNCISSFYGFMKANQDDYPTWQFTAPEYRNRYGI